MRLRFRRSFKVAPGVRVNLSKSGIGMSAGVRGARVGIGPRGSYTSVGIPGTGIYGIEYHSRNKASSKRNVPSDNNPSIASFPIPEELKQGGSSIGYLGVFVGLIMLFISRIIGIIAIVAGFAFIARTPNAQALQLYKQANKAAKKGDYKTASDHLEEVLNHKPELAATKLHLGMLQYSLENYPEAIKWFEEYLEVSSDAAVKFRLVIAYRYAEEYEKALEMLQSLPEATKQDESCPL